MPNAWRRREFTVRVRLAITILAILVPALLFSGLVVYQFAAAQRKVLEDNVRQRVTGIEAALDQQFDEVIAGLDLAAALPASSDDDLAALARNAAGLAGREPFTAGLALYDRTGARLRSFVDGSGAHGLPPFDRATLDRVVATGRPAVSNLVPAPDPGSSAVMVAVPVTRSGHVDYVLSTGITSDRLNRVLRDQHLPSRWLAAFVDPAGIIGARNRDPDKSVGRAVKPEFMEHTAGGDTGAFTMSPDGVEVYGVYVRSPGTGWMAAIGMPRAPFEAPMRRSLRILAIGGGAALLLGLALAMREARSILAAVAGLAAAARALGNGEAPSLAHDGIRELRVVADELAAAGRQRRAAEAALRANEKRLQLTLANTPVIVYDCDTALRYTWIANRPAHLGPEIIGKRDDELMPPGDVAELVAFKRGLIESDRGGRQEIPLTIDGELKWYDTAAEPLRDDQGKLTGLAIVQLDITAQREVERLLRQAQKMEALSQLTSGVAHDFNNLLTVIIGNLEYLRDGFIDEQRLRCAKAALSAADRGATLVSLLLSFGRGQMLRPQAHDINTLITEFSGMVRGGVTQAVDVVYQTAASAAVCSIDRAGLELAMLNIVVNARHAMPDGGTLRISVEDFPVARRSSKPELPAGDYVRLAFTDSGSGMTPEVAARAFDPFFTTKGTGHGTGLGLSQVYGFVKQSGGDVVIESPPGGGTTMALYLPRVAAAVEKPAAAAPGVRLHGTAIVVEDTPDVLESVVGMLEVAGCTVMRAQNGPEGLALVREHSLELDFMLTDVVMPGAMSGIELAEAALGACPDLKIVFMTGDAGTQDLPSRHPVLRKPFHRADLIAVVANLQAGV